MFRARLLTLTLAAGLGVSGGCCGMSERHLFPHFGHRMRTEPETVVGAEVCPTTEGPAVQDFGPYPAPAAPAPAVGPQPLAAPQRLEPLPQAPPVPYQPTRNLR